MSALAEPPWCVCSACLSTPEVFTLGVMQLAALLGFPYWLTQVGCSTPVVMVSLGVGGLSCPSCTVPPLFSFLCLRSFPFHCFPFGVLPPYRVGWHVCLQCAGLLFGVAGGGLLQLFPQCLCAVFPAAGTLVCSVQKTYLRLLTIGLALARASAQLQDSNIPPTGRVAGGDTLSPSVL